MVGLLDIAPAVAKVTVRGTPVDVVGVSAKGVANLLGRFPELRQMMSGRTVDADKLLAVGGDCVAAIIAAGTGSPGNADVEAVAVSLPIEEQADLLAAILRVTLPGGIGPFVEKLSALGLILNADGGAAPVTAPDTKSPKPSKPS